MKNDEGFQHKSYGNAVSSVRTDVTLPLNVFVGAWGAFLFFQSDSIFEPEFIVAMRALLNAEGSHVCCLVNLGAVKGENNEPPARYLDRSTDAVHYMSLLRGNGSPDAWLYLVDRYICTSDVGEWCIYCEKENDIAVMALRNVNSLEKFYPAIAQLKADQLKTVCGIKGGGIFPFNKLTSAWRDALVEHYG